MRGLINFQQSFAVDAGINLRVESDGVAEQFLDSRAGRRTRLRRWVAKECRRHAGSRCRADSSAPRSRFHGS